MLPSAAQILDNPCNRYSRHGPAGSYRAGFLAIVPPRGMHWLGGSSAWLSMARTSRSNACSACGWMNSSCGKVILNVSMWLPWLPGSTLTISPKKLPGRDMTSTPVASYRPNGWSRTSREQPAGPLLSFSGSVANRWRKTANGSDLWTFPLTRCPIDLLFPFCSHGGVRRSLCDLGRRRWVSTGFARVRMRKAR